MGNNIGSIGAPKQQIIGDDLPKKPVATIKQNANPQTESTTNAANQRANLNDYGAAMRFKLQNKLTQNATNQTFQTKTDDAPRDFETIGGDWRVKNDDGSLKFYRTGENTDGTTRFDKEYFQIDETEFIHLNKNGALIDLPTNAGKPQPENVTDLDWFGHERVTPNRVPADYTSTGKTIAFDNPRDANDKTNVLKRYVVDNNLVKGTWDEAKAVNALKLAIADGVKVEITEIDKRGDGKTEYKVTISNDDLQKLRGRLADYKREVSQDVKDGIKGGQEADRTIGDFAIRVPANTISNTA
ncbi:MAG: hypothetical protein H7Z37_01030, partial [Pyrinomonadaceae bacterium]|nr:hypothetical protein [Pyrinomonadaceae bacterium]